MVLYRGELTKSPAIEKRIFVTFRKIWILVQNQMNQLCSTMNPCCSLTYYLFIMAKYTRNTYLLAPWKQTPRNTVFNNASQLFWWKRYTNKKYFSMRNRRCSSMVEHQRGFVTFLKRKVPNVTTIHYIIYRQHLVATIITQHLNTSFSTVIAYVSKIGANPLNSRLSKQLSSNNDEEFQTLTSYRGTIA